MAWNTAGSLKGPKGDDSTVPGPRGSKWFSGTVNPTTVAGSQPGDWYLNTVTGEVFELV